MKHPAKWTGLCNTTYTFLATTAFCQTLVLTTAHPLIHINSNPLPPNLPSFKASSKGMSTTTAFFSLNATASPSSKLHTKMSQALHTALAALSLKALQAACFPSNRSRRRTS